MELLRSYFVHDIDRDDAEPSSPPILFPAPSVDYTSLALSCATYNRTLSRPIDPTQHSIAFNPTYDQLWTPIYGPAHPFSSSSGLTPGLRNHMLGSVDDASINSSLFDEQYNTFQVFGYAFDPSAPSANAPVGDLEALQKNLSSLSVNNLPPSVHEHLFLEQKTPHAEDDQGDAAEEERVDVENPAIDAWLSGKREELQTELTEEQKNYAEEHSVVSLRQTMETKGGGRYHLIPNRQRQPTPLVGRRAFFWDLEGSEPEGKVIWRLWISFGERSPTVFKTYYTVESTQTGAVDQDDESTETGVEDQDDESTETGAEDQDDESTETGAEDQDVGEVDQDAVDETYGIQIQCVFSGPDVTCYPTKDKFHFLLFDILEFIRTFSPPATIVFVSGNAEFAPFLRKVKEKGYHLLVISESECASSAFRDCGLTLYDLIPAIHGEGFFPLEEHDFTEEAR